MTACSSYCNAVMIPDFNKLLIWVDSLNTESYVDLI